ncbi:uncharacterized protein [Salvelinus alpinus]|uniref:uncharacterized protein n=1 Tax=Salvelinus alpinus TaxID=8036 RepID=UPI0039FC70F5
MMEIFRRKGGAAGIKMRHLMVAISKSGPPEEALSATNAKLKLQVARVDSLRQENEGTSNKVAALEAELNATEEDLEAQKVEVGRLRGLEENLNSLEQQQLDGQRVLVARLNATKSELEAEVQELKRDNRANVALKGVAAQSSLYGIGEASNAIDGNREPEYNKRSCSHTQDDTNPWWRVDLLDLYRVTAVTITNRGDVVPERLDGAEIRIGNSLENNGINNPRCVVISHIPAGETNTFQCNEMDGRYVVVVIPGQNKILTLCEVEVYGTPAVNVVVKGVATQSSLYGDGQANNAIDGNRESNYHKMSCTHTAQETNPWWRVDLLDVYRVTAVSITNRGDCCSERLNDAEIRIGNSLENNGINNPRCVVISHIPAGETNTFQCNEMDGRYVVVVIPGQNKILTLCEVEVYGTPAVNVVVKGVATQSSLYGDGQANNAIDGNRESNYHKMSCTHTAQETNPWWRVDLLDVYRVTAVSITNRGDCCSERLNDAEIRIGNSLENNGINNPRCVVISHIPAGETNTFQCNEMDGRYVVVVIPGQNKILTLCEVEVYGTPAVNVAVKGVATQSSLYGDGQANNSIDGNRESNYHKMSCTHTAQETNPWWRVDLLDLYRVTAVSITNRGDVAPERLDGAEIRIGNSQENNGINNPRCVVISHIPAGETYTFQCNAMEGRYVVVVIPGQNKILTL